MEKQVKLKDGTEVVIRNMKKDDLDRSLKFFKDLPEEDRMYLRLDVTKKEVIKHRIETMLAGEVIRIVAVKDDEIVGDGALELKGHGWIEHLAEMRLIIARQYQHLGLGMLMAEELYYIATKKHLEKIVVQMMRPQVAAHKIFRKLGFHEEVIMPQHVKDMKGQSQDLIHMTCDLIELKKQLEQLFLETDWRSRR